MDRRGRPPAPEPAADGGGRAVTRRVLADGTEVALVHDPAAIADPAAAESAVAVAATAVDNARREREVRERIEHLRRPAARRCSQRPTRSGACSRTSCGSARCARPIGSTSCSRVPGERAERSGASSPVARPSWSRSPAASTRPPLARDGLIAALLQAVADARARSRSRSTRGVDDAAVPEPIALAAYYVASEALANVAKHAGAASARVELGAADAWLIVRVRDDGAGGADPNGRGLSGLRDRVATVDGVLRVVSPPGGGTVVEARLPL